jgi:hypothetical protein
MLRLDGWAFVTDVSFDEKGVDRDASGCPSAAVASGRVRADRPASGDRRLPTKRWRHLDLVVNRCVLERELRRLRCPDCGCANEAVR